MSSSVSTTGSRLLAPPSLGESSISRAGLRELSREAEKSVFDLENNLRMRFAHKPWMVPKHLRKPYEVFEEMYMYMKLRRNPEIYSGCLIKMHSMASSMYKNLLDSDNPDRAGYSSWSLSMDCVPSWVCWDDKSVSEVKAVLRSNNVKGILDLGGGRAHFGLPGMLCYEWKILSIDDKSDGNKCFARPVGGLHVATGDADNVAFVNAEAAKHGISPIGETGTAIHISWGRNGFPAIQEELKKKLGDGSWENIRTIYHPNSSGIYSSCTVWRRKNVIAVIVGESEGGCTNPDTESWCGSDGVSDSESDE